jgi:hypothetical protein
VRIVDEAAIDRYAQAIHATREAWCDEQDPVKFISHGWDERPEHMKRLDRLFASAVAEMAVQDAYLHDTEIRAENALLRARLAEIRQVITTFFVVHGNSTAASLQSARDLAEGIRQIADRAPQP